MHSFSDDGPTAGPDRPPGPAARAARALATTAALAAVAMFPAAGSAQDADTPSLSFDVFGTLGGVYSTEENADFVWNPFTPDGPGHSYTVSPETDSRLGGQLTASITPELTAVAQVVVEQTHDEDYDPSLEWGYLQYAFSPDLSVRAGRMPIPAFMVSEFRKVSYANPWIRPPVELYSIIPVFSFDGVDARYRLHTGEWTNVFRVSAGRNEAEFGSPGDVIESERNLHLNYTLRRGALRTRIGFSRGELDWDGLDPFFDAFRQFGPEGERIADRYEVDETPYGFVTLGAEYDPGGWFAMGEAALIDLNSIFANSAAGYVSGGYRVGPVTPFATYSRIERTNAEDVPGLPVATLPPPLRPTAGELNAVLDLFREWAVIQQNLAVGARWDLRPGVALKAQVDFIDMLEDSPGTFQNRQPGFEFGGSAQLFSLATSFVF